MAGRKQLFKYKCSRDHITTEWFLPGTRLADYDEISCVECAKTGDVQPAYVVSIEFEPPREVWHVK
jgi:hypothetical protein